MPALLCSTKSGDGCSAARASGASSAVSDCCADEYVGSR